MDNATISHKTQEKSTANSEVSKIAVNAVGITAGLVGVWAVACMVAGILNSNGPISLISNTVKAIFG